MKVRAARAFPSAAESGVMTGFPPVEASKVTLANWQTAPFNRWGFLHTREIIPSANISRGAGDVWHLDSAEGRVETIQISGDSGSPMTLPEFLDSSWTDGMIVVHRGRIVLEAYRNEMTETRRHVAMSVSKSITSLLIGILVERRLVDPAAPVIKYLPELVGTAYDSATVQHVLDMQVANAWKEDYVSPTSEYWRIDVAAGWLPAREGAALTLFDFMKSSRRDGEHGESIQYSSLNTDLLGLVAERAAGARFAELASTLLWQPAGMEFDADITLDRAGSAACDGGFCIALHDLARIGQLFLNRGAAPGRQVVNERWIDECRRPNSKPFASTSYGAELPGASYRNQWWLIEGRSFALGIHGQMIAVDVDAEIVVGILSSAPEPNDLAQRLTQFGIVAEISKQLAR